jgi:predicted GTPase
MGYDDEQLRELEATIDAAECDVVVTGTPFDLGRLIATRHPLRHARYEIREIGHPPLHDVIAALEHLAHQETTVATG